MSPLSTQRTLRTPRVLLALVVVVASLGLAACVKPDKAVIAFLLASSEADRWKTLDRPSFEAHVDESCRGCDVLTFIAEQDADRQAEQFEEAIDEGADVIVLNAVDGESGASLVREAGEIPVIAYDRFLTGADFYVAADPAVIGRLMAQSLVDAVGAGAQVLMINGAARDPNGVAIREAARGVFARHKVKVLHELVPRSWSTAAARDFVVEHGAELDRVDAVFASNDTQAAGVAEAYEQLGRSGGARPFVTGQDAELDAVRRLVSGDQGMTVYKDIRTMAQRAADLAIDLMLDTAPDDATTYQEVPAILVEPIAVTRGSIAQIVVRERVYSLNDICTPTLQQACESLALR
ncbi:substrate-binding domain-containing protein [Nocardioides gilvus]|uniref:substrate-binding domain-containing protein n=1 Tax=Nocardioides gilvus TaxID=1735589 RepID=UPI0013A56068|nr:substrate-binding domain-containing protein [Nocardioides gilvus]